MKISIARAHDASQRTQFFTTLDDARPEDLCRYQWSPIIWNGGRRLEVEFRFSTSLVLDFDDGKWSLKDADTWVRSFHFKATIGTTKSHRKDKNGLTCDRFRIVVPWTSHCDDLHAHRQNMYKVLLSVPADRACIDGARSYKPFKEIVGTYEGKTLNWDKFRERKQKPVYFIRNSVPDWIHNILTNGAADGQRNGTCFRVAANLVKCGLRDDEIEAMIVGSNIDLPEREKRNAARSGIKAGRNRFGDGRC